MADLLGPDDPPDPRDRKAVLAYIRAKRVNPDAPSTANPKNVLDFVRAQRAARTAAAQATFEPLTGRAPSMPGLAESVEAANAPTPIVNVNKAPGGTVGPEAPYHAPEILSPIERINKAVGSTPHAQFATGMLVDSPLRAVRTLESLVPDTPLDPTVTGVKSALGGVRHGLEWAQQNLELPRGLIGGGARMAGNFGGDIAQTVYGGAPLARALLGRAPTTFLGKVGLGLAAGTPLDLQGTLHRDLSLLGLASDLTGNPVLDRLANSPLARGVTEFGVDALAGGELEGLAHYAQRPRTSTDAPVSMEVQGFAGGGVASSDQAALIVETAPTITEGERMAQARIAANPDPIAEARSVNPLTDTDPARAEARRIEESAGPALPPAAYQGPERRNLLDRLPDTPASDIINRHRRATDLPPVTAPGAPPARAAAPDWGPPIGIVRMPAHQIAADPGRFQFKQLGASGVNSELKGVKVWNDALAGVVSVWRDPADGRVYVVNGHHRLDLAQRLGVPELNVRFIEAADAHEARAEGAYMNIAEGRGTATDVGKFLRDNGQGAEELVRRGVPLPGNLARDGLALSKLAPDLFDQVATEKMPQGWGVALGEMLPGDAVLQREALAAVRGSGKRLTNAEVREVARQVRDAGTEAVHQTTLLGEEVVQRGLFIHKAQLAASIKKKLATDKRLFGFVAKEGRAENLSRAGDTKIDVDAARELAEGSAMVEEIFDRLYTRSGPIADLMNTGARRIANGERTAAVLADIYDAVGDAVRAEAAVARGGGAHPRQHPSVEVSGNVADELAARDADEGRVADSQDPDQAGMFSPGRRPTEPFTLRSEPTGPEQTGMFGAREGTPAARTLAETEAAARSEMAALRQRLTLERVPRKQAILAARIVELEKLVRRAEPITAEDLRIRALAEKAPKPGEDAAPPPDPDQLGFLSPGRKRGPDLSSERGALGIPGGPGFTSRLHRAAKGAKIEKAPFQTWVSKLRGRESSADEFDWTFRGLSDEARKRVWTKAEMEAYTAEYGYGSLTEVVRGGAYQSQMDVNPIGTNAQGQAQWGVYGFDNDGAPVRSGTITRVESQMGGPQFLYQKGEGLERRIFGSLEAAQDYLSAQGGAPAKYAGYQEPGGTNYREVLVRTPNQLPEGFTVEEFGDIDGKTSWGVRFPDGRVMTGWRTRADAIASQRNRKGADTFRSSHWDEDNVLFHIRMNDRVGPKGEKVLHVEEIQSDWHQQGRKQGYANENRARLDELDAKYDRVVEEYNRAETETRRLAFGDELNAISDERDAIIRRINENKTIPDAPLKNTPEWMGLAMKRVLDEAVAGGYDAVSWTPGIKQADRYSLRKVAEWVGYQPSTGKLLADDAAQNSVHRGTYTPEQLPDVIGKEATERLLEAPLDEKGFHNLTGEQLEIGGEGMKAFYDQMLPDWVRGYAKKLGVKLDVGMGDAVSPGAKATGPHRDAILNAMAASSDPDHQVIATALLRFRKEGVPWKDLGDRFALSRERGLVGPTVRNRILADVEAGRWPEGLAQRFPRFAVTPELRAAIGKGQTYGKGAVPIMSGVAGAGTGALAGAAMGDTPEERRDYAIAGALAGAGLGAGAGRLAERMGAPKGRVEEVRTLMTMGRNLADAIGVPLRQGRFNAARRKAAGVFYPHKEVTRVVRYDKLDTVAHEVGHYISKKWLRNPTMTSANFRGAALAPPPLPREAVRELVQMGKDLYGSRKPNGGYGEEGIAEWVSFYVTEPHTLQAKAPVFTQFMEALLEREPMLRDGLRQARDDFARYQAAPASQRIAAMIDTKPAAWSMPTVRRLKTLALDDLNEFREAVRDITDEGTLSPSQNAYTLARLTRGGPGAAEEMLDRGMVAYGTTKRVAPSVVQTLQSIPTQRLQAFREYLVAESALERWAQGIDPGISQADAAATAAAGKAEFEAAGEALWQHGQALIDYRVAGGLLTPEEGKLIKSKNQRRVGFYRVFDPEETASGGGFGKRFARNSSGLQRQTGSARPIIDPLESVLSDTYKTVAQVHKHEVLRTLVKLARQTEGSGRVIEEVPAPQVAQRIPAEKLQQQLADMGLVYMGMDEKTGQPFVVPLGGPGGYEVQGLLTAFDDAVVPGPKESKDLVFPLIDKGKRTWYAVRDRALYDAIAGLGAHEMTMAERILSAPTRTLRAGATLTPEFIGRNPVRDAWSASIYSGANFRPPGWRLGQGLFHYFKADDVYQRWRLSGGDNAAMLGIDRPTTHKAVRQLHATGLARGWDVVRHPIETLRMVSSISENATRLGEFAALERKALKGGASPRDAALGAALGSRNVTIDFARGGTAAKEINKIVAFFNANLQGTAQLARELKTRPHKVIPRAVAAITVPSVALYLMQRDDPAYQDMPDWVKAVSWVYVQRGTDQGEGWDQYGTGKVEHVWVLPKPFELGVLFGTVPERIVEYLDTHDPDAVRAAERALVKAFTPPVMPTAAAPLIENWANKSFFLDRPVVPRSVEGRAPASQAKPTTGATARTIGKALDYAPAKVDNLIRGWTGGIGSYATSGLDAVIEAGRKAAGLPPLRPPTAYTGRDPLTRIPGAKAFTRPAPGLDAESVERVYRYYEQNERHRKEWRALLAEGRTQEAAAYLAKHRAQIMSVATEEEMGEGKQGPLRQTYNEMQKLQTTRKEMDRRGMTTNRGNVVDAIRSTARAAAPYLAK